MSTNLALTAREMELLKAIGKYIQASNVSLSCTFHLPQIWLTVSLLGRLEQDL